MVQPFIPKEKYETLKSVIDGQVYDCYMLYRTGVSQSPPYVNTPFSLVMRRSFGPVNIGSFPYNTAQAAFDEATNKARSRFVNELGDASSFGATATAELHSTWGTVTSSVTNIFTAAKAVKRGKLGEAAKILGFSPPIAKKTVMVSRRKVGGGRYRKKLVTRQHWVMPSGKYVAKSLANKWLWFSYGIKPLVSDIANGMDVLTRPAPYSAQVKKSARSVRIIDRTTDWGLRALFKSSVTITIRARVSVSNPNLWLANQMGLVNPVQAFNEGIPFSFVIDWFSNLSQMIMQMTDFVGLEIAEPLTVSKYEHSTTYTETWYPTAPIKTCLEEGYSRKLEIPRAKLVFAYERFEWQRGANAVSLLVGLLKTVRR